MHDEADDRRLTIGAYAAATQLTAKALRLYDESGLLRPVSTDPATGYRYYRAEQVATGRLVRTLRDMNCSLSQIAQVLEAPAGLRSSLLRGFLHEAEQRLARERNAYQAALMLMRPRSVSEVQPVETVIARARIVMATDFTTNRRDFVSHALRQYELYSNPLSASGLRVHPEFGVLLVEPLTDEEGRVELLIDIDGLDDTSSKGVATRHIPERRYALTHADPAEAIDGFTACVDGLFDWFDKQGARALGFPEVLLMSTRDELRARVRWAFHPDSEA